MDAILFIGHGTRLAEGAKQAKKFIEMAKQNLKEYPIRETCFLELTEPDLLTGIERCIKRGAKKIHIVPVLLLTAVHAKKDIPLEIEKAKKKYPHVQFVYGNTLGIHPLMIEALLDRIFEKKKPTKNDSVLIVARGSSDPEIEVAIHKIAQQLHDLYPFKHVDVCFMYGAKPNLQEGLLKQKDNDSDEIFVVPYLLFTGLLMEEIEAEIEKLNINNKRFNLCEGLGFHPNVLSLLQTRAKELLQTEKA